MIVTTDLPSGFIGESGIWGPAIPNGAPAISFPLESQNNYAKLYAQPYIVHSGVDAVGTIGSSGLFDGTYLVAESERQPLLGGFVTFSRFFAEIPSGFDDFATVTYTFPALQTWRTQPYTETVSARIYSDFYLTDNPQGIEISGAQRWRNIYGFDVGTLSAITTPTATVYSGWCQSGVEFLPQAANVTRYFGNIWRRETPYIKAH